MANNYETMKLQMRDEFLKYDQAAMIGKFGLCSDDENLFITFFGTEYAVDRRTGDVRSKCISNRKAMISHGLSSIAWYSWGMPLLMKTTSPWEKRSVCSGV